MLFSLDSTEDGRGHPEEDQNREAGQVGAQIPEKLETQKVNLIVKWIGGFISHYFILSI